MKNTLTTLCLLLTSSALFAQKYSPDVEAQTLQLLDEVSRGQKIPFSVILENRKTLDVLRRIDTVAFDYALIEESFTLGDSVAQVTERYFVEADREILDYSLASDQENTLGAIPRTMFVNAHKAHVQNEYYATSVAYTMFYDLIDYYYTLDTILANYGAMRPVQELIYDQSRIQNEITNNFAEKKQELEQAQVDRLKKTYQIVTLIDNKNKNVRVSVQLPPKNPFVELRYVERYHYSW